MYLHMYGVDVHAYVYAYVCVCVTFLLPYVVQDEKQETTAETNGNFTTEQLENILTAPYEVC